MSKCSIPGCEKPRKMRDLCSTHYRRWERYRDPLKTKRTPPGKAMRFLKGVALTYAGDGCLAWPYGHLANGYGSVWHEGRARIVSRLLCEFAHGPPPEPFFDAAHSCGNGHKGCCNPRHLSWKTRTGNMQDMVAHGKSNRGKRHPCNVLDPERVRKIRALRGLATHSEIAKQFGIAQAQVSRIQTRKSWAWLD